MPHNNCDGFEVCGTDVRVVRIELVRNALGNYSTELPVLPAMKTITIRTYGEDQLEMELEFESNEAAQRAIGLLKAY